MNLLDAAVVFADRGWPVFPVAPRGKVPAIESAHPEGDPLRGICKGECGQDGHGLLDATTESDKIREWWTERPRANIGVRTGVVCDVLDIDAHHDGCQSLVELLDEHGCLPSGPSASTPRGGVHLYFAPTGLPNTVNIRQGIDWRGANGYVVVPPSTRSEGAYEWGLRPSEFPLLAAPAWLVDLHPQSRRAQPGVTGSSSNTKTTSDAYGRRALEAEIGRLSMACEGDRNHQLNRSAFALGQLVAGGVLDAAEVVDALVMAAERIGLESKETENAIRSGLGDGMRQPRKAKT